MPKMHKPKHFQTYELLPEDFYEAHKHLGDDKLWLMFDDRALQTADWLRDVYGPITLNDWRWGGRNHYRGWRPWECIGVLLSQHKFGRALDCVFRDVSAEEVRQDIRKDPYSGVFQHITAIEDGVGWLHLDTRNWDKERHGILIVKP